MTRSLSVVLSVALTVAGLAAGSALAASWQSKVDASVLQAAQSGATDFIVYMQAHADLSGAAGRASKAAKGAFVYDALTTTARNSQAGVVGELTSRDTTYSQFWIANAIVTRGNLELIQTLASRSDVRNIFALGLGRQERPIHAPQAVTETAAAGSLTNSIAHVRADQAWALGYRGQGAVVAGADSGVRWTHSALKAHYRGWNAATGAASHDYNWHDAIKWQNTACPANSPQPCDDDVLLGGGHGTHTMGTMVGDDGAGNQTGMAPGAKWMACRNMNNGVGAVPLYMDCMQWFLAPTRIDGSAPDPSKSPDVINNSWGCVEVCAPPILKDVIDASRAAGIFYVVSAGNDNQWFLGLHMQCNTIAFPLAIFKSAFTVGATGATTDGIADYSSLGPVSDNPIEGVNYRKPDITAPGSDIRSSLAGSDTEYGLLSGTSMAGPHVAGLVALIISANPALRGHVDAIEDIIESTAVPLTSDLGCGGDSDTIVPNNVYGYGRIDALAAVQKALGTTPDPTPTPVAQADAVVSAMSATEQKPKSGATITVSATVRNQGNAQAAASRTEFRFADGSLLGVVDTPAMPAGGSATVSVGWDTRGANGDYVITAIADASGLVAESNETNNRANLTVSVRGNKVQNQSFEQSNSAGNAPESWQASSTQASSSGYSQAAGSASDGTDSVTLTGTGKSALLYGAPTWSSAPFAVTPGQVLTVAVDAKSVGLSSAPSLSLAYLGPTGELLNTVKLLTAPLSTNGFAQLTGQVQLPVNVASVRIVLAGFAPTDAKTAGTVTFDNVGAWGE